MQKLSIFLIIGFVIVAIQCSDGAPMNLVSAESEENSNEKSETANKIELNDDYSNEGITEPKVQVPHIDQDDHSNEEQPIRVESVEIPTKFDAIDWDAVEDDGIDVNQMDFTPIINRRILHDDDDDNNNNDD